MKNTVIALVLVAALGGVLFYLNRHPAKAPADTSGKQKIFSFQPDQVKEFTIEDPNHPAIKIRRVSKTVKPVAAGSNTGSQWEVVSPAGVAGDTSEIQSFIDDLPRREFTQLESQTPTSLAEYGLDKPTRTLKFDTNQGQTVTLRLGKENPGGSSKYALLSSTPGLFLIDDYENKDFDKSLYDLRDKRILPIATDKLQRFEVKFVNVKPSSSPETEKGRKLGLPVRPPEIVFTKEGNNWQLTKPAVRTSFTDSNYLITAVTGSLMKTAEAEDPKSLATYGLDHPQIRVDITSADSTYSLLVGNRRKESDLKPEENMRPQEPGKSKETDRGYYAKNSMWPLVFSIHDAIFDQLNQDLETYRNRYLFDFESPDAATRIEVQGPQGELRFDRKGADWFKAGATPTKVDTNRVTAWLEAIHTIRIQQFTEDKPRHFAEYGLQKPWMTVKVTSGAVNKEETVVFGLKNKKLYAARTDGPSVYEMGPSDQDTLEQKLKDVSQ